LLNLPGEIQNKALDELEPFGLLQLRATCHHFRTIVPLLGIDELVMAETNQTALERDLYACCLCLRLRHSTHFADNMMWKAKKNSEGESVNRFCIPCGLRPPPGKNGYPKGILLTRNGLWFVICRHCAGL
ncbi:hypothetical protein N658DRAFT_390285, partial [Parathielavia hyrcaniae]